MFSLWYLVFGFVALTAASIVGLCVFKNLRDESFTSGYKQSRKYEVFDNVTDVCVGLTILNAILVVALTIVAICVPISAKNEMRQYQYQYEMCESLIEDGSLEQNVLIGSVAKDANIWLANARADKARWGNWSMYYDCDLDSLKYIGER